ncbi:MAG: SRPBCC domain-containing protein, partial [Hyphomicrobiaceae bacterium]
MSQAITIHTHVPVGPQAAWDAYTSADAITRWNQASPDWHCPSASVELSVGGTHTARMEARDGSFGFDFEGVYEEVDPPHALTLRLGDGRASRTTFIAEADGTRVTTTFDPETEKPVEMQRDG